MITSIRIPIRTKYQTELHSFLLSVEPVQYASMTVPDSIMSAGLYSIVGAIFDDEKNKRKRFIETPLTYTFQFTVASFFNEYNLRIFNELCPTEKLLKKLFLSVMAAIPSAVIPHHREASSTLFWNVFLQTGTSMFMTTINHFIAN